MAVSSGLQLETIRLALDGAPVAIALVDREAGVVYANPLAVSLFQSKGYELSSLSLERLLSLLRPLGSRPPPGGNGDPRKVSFEAVLPPAASQTGEPLPLDVTLAPNGDRLVMVYLEDASERTQLRDRYDGQVRRLAALRSIDLAITGSLDLNVTLDVILDHITRQLGVDAADVLLFDEHLGRLEFGACRGFRTDALKHTNLALGASFAGKAALDRRVVSVADLWEGASPFRSSPLLASEGFVTYAGIPLVAKGEVKGVLELFTRTPMAHDEDWLEYAKALGQQAAIAIDNASLLGELQRSNMELARAYDSTLEGWSRTLDLRDHETEGHSERVTGLTVRLAREVGIRGDDLLHVRRGALLHDIGKMGIPDGILLKAGPLSDEEWVVMRRHPQYAYDVLAPIGYLRPAIDIPYYHHEHWDGSGYPNGLQGDRIPLTARVFALADVWDALTSHRPYRAAWSPDHAVAHIRDQAGRQFDPALVDRFLGLLESFQ